MTKSRVLLIGCGGIGTVAALNLQTGLQADVSVVLRSNYTAVQAAGFRIDSCDHGVLENWKPATGIFRYHACETQSSLISACSSEFRTGYKRRPYDALRLHCVLHQERRR